MPSPSPTELKKQLILAGFEIFRVQGDRVHLADRVRDNLIMDACVAAVCADPPRVRLVVRSQGSHFPGEPEAALFGHARAAAAGAQARGYLELAATAVPVKDPGGADTTIDVWYEVTYEKTVTPGDLIDELRYALGVEKTAGTG